MSCITLFSFETNEQQELERGVGSGGEAAMESFKLIAPPGFPKCIQSTQKEGTYYCEHF